MAKQKQAAAMQPTFRVRRGTGFFLSPVDVATTWELFQRSGQEEIERIEIAPRIRVEPAEKESASDAEDDSSSDKKQQAKQTKKAKQAKRNEPEHEREQVVFADEKRDVDARLFAPDVSYSGAQWPIFNDVCFLRTTKLKHPHYLLPFPRATVPSQFVWCALSLWTHITNALSCLYLQRVRLSAALEWRGSQSDVPPRLCARVHGERRRHAFPPDE